MSCQHIDGLLPWFLNGTLSDDEVREVKEHLEGCAACRRGLADTAYVGNLFAGESSVDPQTIPNPEMVAEHPTVNALLDYVFEVGVGTAAEAGERIEAHLETCSECREQVALVAESKQPMGTVPAAGREHEGESKASTVVPEASDPPLAFPSAAHRSHAAHVASETDTVHRGWRWAAIAASFFGAVALGAGLIAAGVLSSGRAEQNARLEDYKRRVVELSTINEHLEAAAEETSKPVEVPGTNPESNDSATPEVDPAAEQALQAAEVRIAELESALSAPRLNTAIVDLFADDVVLRGDEMPAATVPQGSDWVTLILNPSAELGNEVGVRLLDSEGVELWRRSGLRLDVNGGYVLTVPASALPSNGGTFVIDDGEGGSARFTLER